MTIRLRLASLALLVACGCSGGPPVRPAAPPPSAAPPPENAPPADPPARPPCAPPHDLQPIAAGAVSARSRADPPADHGFTPRDDLRTLILGGRVFTLTEDRENRIVARDAGGRLLWTSDPEEVAGGSFAVYASPGGKLVARLYSRGKTDVYRAADGQKVAEVMRDAVFAADDSFVLDPPAIAWGTSQYETRDVVKRTLGRSPASRVVARFPVPVGTAIDPSFDTEAFGVDVCGASVYAFSQPSGLEVRRAADDERVASVPDPGPGTPRFSRSGKILYLLHGGSVTRAYALVP